MSADNWADCPRCDGNLHKKRKELLAIAAAKYGEIPPEEYLKLINAAEATMEGRLDTLREDYEIGISGGQFIVSYGARCEKCGLRFQYNYKQDVE